MIPDFQTLMKPVLELASDGEIQISDAVSRLEDAFGLSAEERAELLPSGKQTRFANRVHWARSYLKQAGLLSSPRRGFFVASERGRQVLQDDPIRIDRKYLEQFEDFLAFQERTQQSTIPAVAKEETENATPDELLRSAHANLTATLAADLVDRLRESAPVFFEDVIVQLLLAMGYGHDASAGQVLGQAGDDGVDGVINLDPLGVDQVYVQAKRYGADNKIGAGAIRDFYGALGLKDVTKGIFVTTSSFSPSAEQTAEKLGARIVLIDGAKLGRLMVAHEVGCRVTDTYKVATIEESFFE